eukprot:532549-Amorphochlora_amoeboformis.AAC.1
MEIKLELFRRERMRLAFSIIATRAPGSCSACTYASISPLVRSTNGDVIDGYLGIDIDIPRLNISDISLMII